MEKKKEIRFTGKLELKGASVQSGPEDTGQPPATHLPRSPIAAPAATQPIRWSKVQGSLFMPHLFRKYHPDQISPQSVFCKSEPSKKKGTTTPILGKAKLSQFPPASSLCKAELSQFPPASSLCKAELSKFPPESSLCKAEPSKKPTSLIGKNQLSQQPITSFGKFELSKKPTATSLLFGTKQPSQQPTTSSFGKSEPSKKPTATSLLLGRNRVTQQPSTVTSASGSVSLFQGLMTSTARTTVQMTSPPGTVHPEKPTSYKLHISKKGLRLTPSTSHSGAAAAVAGQPAQGTSNTDSREPIWFIERSPTGKDEISMKFPDRPDQVYKIRAATGQQLNVKVGSSLKPQQQQQQQQQPPGARSLLIPGSAGMLQAQRNQAASSTMGAFYPPQPVVNPTSSSVAMVGGKAAYTVAHARQRLASLLTAEATKKAALSMASQTHGQLQGSSGGQQSRLSMDRILSMIKNTPAKAHLFHHGPIKVVHEGVTYLIKKNPPVDGASKGCGEFPSGEDASKGSAESPSVEDASKGIDESSSGEDASKGIDESLSGEDASKGSGESPSGEDASKGIDEYPSGEDASKGIDEFSLCGEDEETAGIDGNKGFYGVQDDDGYMPIKISSIFSLQNCSEEETPGDILWEEEATTGTSAETPIDVDEFMPEMTQDELLDLCGSSFVVLERLEDNNVFDDEDDDDASHHKTLSRCSDHCRKRTLNYLCVLGLIRCHETRKLALDLCDEIDERKSKVPKLELMDESDERDESKVPKLEPLSEKRKWMLDMDENDGGCREAKVPKLEPMFDAEDVAVNTVSNRTVSAGDHVVTESSSTEDATEGGTDQEASQESADSGEEETMAGVDLCTKPCTSANLAVSAHTSISQVSEGMPRDDPVASSPADISVPSSATDSTATSTVTLATSADDSTANSSVRLATSADVSTANSSFRLATSTDDSTANSSVRLATSTDDSTANPTSSSSKASSVTAIDQKKLVDSSSGSVLCSDCCPDSASDFKGILLRECDSDHPTGLTVDEEVVYTEKDNDDDSGCAQKDSMAEETSNAAQSQPVQTNTPSNKSHPVTSRESCQWSDVLSKPLWTTSAATIPDTTTLTTAVSASKTASPRRSQLVKILPKSQSPLHPSVYIPVQGKPHTFSLLPRPKTGTTTSTSSVPKSLLSSAAVAALGSSSVSRSLLSTVVTCSSAAHTTVTASQKVRTTQAPCSVGSNNASSVPADSKKQETGKQSVLTPYAVMPTAAPSVVPAGKGQALTQTVVIRTPPAFVGYVPGLSQGPSPNLSNPFYFLVKGPPRENDHSYSSVGSLTAPGQSLLLGTPAAVASSVTRVPVTQGVPITQAVPMTQSVPMTHGVPMTQAVPMANGVPLTQAVPLTQFVSMPQLFPMSQHVPVTHFGPMTGAFPMMKAVPMTSKVGQNYSMVSVPSPAFTLTTSAQSAPVVATSASQPGKSAQPKYRSLLQAPAKQATAPTVPSVVFVPVKAGNQTSTEPGCAPSDQPDSEELTKDELLPGRNILPKRRRKRKDAIMKSMETTVQSSTKPACTPSHQPDSAELMKDELFPGQMIPPKRKRKAVIMKSTEATVLAKQRPVHNSFEKVVGIPDEGLVNKQQKNIEFVRLSSSPSNPGVLIPINQKEHTDKDKTANPTFLSPVAQEPQCTPSNVTPGTSFVIHNPWAKSTMVVPVPAPPQQQTAALSSGAMPKAIRVVTPSTPRQAPVVVSSGMKLVALHPERSMQATAVISSGMKLITLPPGKSVCVKSAPPGAVSLLKTLLPPHTQSPSGSGWRRGGPVNVTVPKSEAGRALSPGGSLLDSSNEDVRIVSEDSKATAESSRSVLNTSTTYVPSAATPPFFQGSSTSNNVDEHSTIQSSAQTQSPTTSVTISKRSLLEIQGNTASKQMDVFASRSSAQTQPLTTSVTTWTQSLLAVPFRTSAATSSVSTPVVTAAPPAEPVFRAPSVEEDRSTQERKRARLEKRYPLPPGVVIKAEPMSFGYPRETTDDSFEEDAADEYNSTPATLTAPDAIAVDTPQSSEASPFSMMAFDLVADNDSGVPLEHETEDTPVSSFQLTDPDFDSDSRDDEPPANLDCPDLDTAHDSSPSHQFDDPPVLIPQISLTAETRTTPASESKTPPSVSSTKTASVRKSHKSLNRKKKRSNTKVNRRVTPSDTSEQAQSGDDSAANDHDIGCDDDDNSLEPAHITSRSQLTEESPVPASSLTLQSLYSSQPRWQSLSSSSARPSAASDRIRELRERLKKENEQLERIRLQRAQQAPLVFDEDDD